MSPNYNITIVCTAHKEIGKCNSNELYKIIECVSPEIIFEELSQTVWDECYVDMRRLTLETIAIKTYLQRNKINHIPVVGSELTNDLDKKFEIFVKNQTYRNLIDSLISSEEKYGFQFLNSNQCDNLFEKIRKLEIMILHDSNDEFLFRLFQCADKIVDTYENDIIQNIYQYSSEIEFDKALIFIGASHRKSIMKKITEYQTREKLNLNWTFYNNI